MSTFQFMLLGVGAFIVMTGFDWTKIRATVSGMIPKKSAISEVLVADNEDSDDLVEVVKKWDDLKDTCEKLGLKEAVDKLNEIFPVLIKVEK